MLPLHMHWPKPKSNRITNTDTDTDTHEWRGNTDGEVLHVSKMFKPASP